MQTTTDRRQATVLADLPDLPGRALLGDVLRLLIVAIVAAVGYDVLLLASKGGGIPAGPREAEQSVDLTLHPRVLVFIAIAAVFFAAVARVRRRAIDGVHAHRILRRAAWAIVIIAAGSLVIAYCWFFATPLEGWPHPGMWIAPLPFGTVHVDLSN